MTVAVLSPCLQLIPGYWPRGDPSGPRVKRRVITWESGVPNPPGPSAPCHSCLNKQNRPVFVQETSPVSVSASSSSSSSHRLSQCFRGKRAAFLLFCLLFFWMCSSTCSCGVCVLDPHKHKDKHRDKEHRHRDHRRDKERDKVKHNNR